MSFLICIISIKKDISVLKNEGGKSMSEEKKNIYDILEEEINASDMSTEEK